MMASSLPRDPVAGLDPAIHVFLHRGACSGKDVDARDKPGQGDFLVWDVRQDDG